MKYDVKRERENIVTNVEIARYDQFLHLSHCFQKSCPAKVLNFVTKRERIKPVEIVLCASFVSGLYNIFLKKKNQSVPKYPPSCPEISDMSRN